MTIFKTRRDASDKVLSMKTPAHILKLAINSEDPVSETQQRLTFKIMHEAGDVLLAALAHPTTTDIALNADGYLWQTCLSSDPEIIGQMARVQAEMFLRTVAAASQTVLTALNPSFEGILPFDGSRISAQIPPVVTAPIFSIRKPASKIFTLDEYVLEGILKPEHREIIKTAIRDHKNILVSGGTGSGKTTFGNGLLHEMVENNHSERIFVIEDTPEIQCTAKNKVSYVATESFSIRHGVRSAMRGHPDRIIVGEVRDGAALDLLLAWNSGHSGGFCTIHADDALGALSKLAFYVSLNNNPPQSADLLIAQAVDIVIQLVKTPRGRRVQEIIAVEGYKTGAYKFNRL